MDKEHNLGSINKNKVHIRLIAIIYISILVALYSLIICTPYLISNTALLKNYIFVGEEFVEGLLISVLLAISFFVLSRYRKRLNRYRNQIKELSVKKTDVENKLSDAFKYIGAVNVQVKEVQSLFSSIEKYPKDKKDFKNSLTVLAQKVLCVANADWVIFRIINVDSLRTLREYSETRGKVILLKHNISNSSIVCSETTDKCSIVSSDQKNLIIKVFCVIPSEALTETQKNLIKTIVTSLEMLFIVFTSQYFRKGYFKQEVFNHAGSM
jgi:hypothetical protein